MEDFNPERLLILTRKHRSKRAVQGADEGSERIAFRNFFGEVRAQFGVTQGDYVQAKILYAAKQGDY